MKKGFTIVMLLVFMVIAITVTSASVILLITNAQSTDETSEGLVAYSAAESGAETGLLRLLRNPSYTGESGVAIGSATVDITIAPTPPSTKELTAIGKYGNFLRRVRVTLDTSTSVNVTSWKEVP